MINTFQDQRELPHYLQKLKPFTQKRKHLFFIDSILIFLEKKKSDEEWTLSIQNKQKIIQSAKRDLRTQLTQFQQRMVYNFINNIEKQQFEQLSIFNNDNLLPYAQVISFTGKIIIETFNQYLLKSKNIQRTLMKRGISCKQNLPQKKIQYHSLKNIYYLRKKQSSNSKKSLQKNSITTSCYVYPQFVNKSNQILEKQKLLALNEVDLMFQLKKLRNCKKWSQYLQRSISRQVKNRNVQVNTIKKIVTKSETIVQKLFKNNQLIKKQLSTQKSQRILKSKQIQLGMSLQTQRIDQLMKKIQLNRQVIITSKKPFKKID